MAKGNNKIECEMSSIGEWNLHQVLGVGCYGTVRLAYHRDYRFAAAVKIINKKLLERPTSMDRLNMEIDSLRRLGAHPKILHLFEVIETDTHIALITEYIGGGDLLGYVQTMGKLDEAEAKGLFRQCVDAMQYAHDQNIVHRDLKAENIFLTADHREIRVGDWGFATPWAPGRRMKERYGSIHYAAPEIFLGREYVGPEVDVWSLGVLLFGLVGGRFPFRGKTDVEIADNTVLGNYKMPTFLSRSCTHLLQCMLQTDPKRRINLKEVRSHPWLSQEESIPRNRIIASQEAEIHALDSKYRPGLDELKAKQKKKNSGTQLTKLLFAKKAAEQQVNISSPISSEDCSPCISPPLECCSPSGSTYNLEEPKIVQTQDESNSAPSNDSTTSTPVDSFSTSSTDSVIESPATSTSTIQSAIEANARPQMKRRVSQRSLTMLQKVKEMLFLKKMSNESNINNSINNLINPPANSSPLMQSPLHKKKKMPDVSSPEFKKSCISDRHLNKWNCPPPPITCNEPPYLAALNNRPTYVVPKIRASS